MAHDPTFTISYGELKAGKTADLLAAFTRHALYVAAPGALAPAESLWGFPQPERVDLATFHDVRIYAEKTVVPGKTLALVVDDATLIADRTEAHLAAKLGGYDLWGAIRYQALALRDSMRRRGCHVAFSMHSVSAETKDGVRLKGGPALRGAARSSVPAAADFLLRAEARGADAFSKADGPSSWGYCYRTAPHPDWLQGSRYGTPDMAPMNLGEILRASGFPIPRLPGLEWQEKIAETMAQALAGRLGDAPFVKDIMQAAFEAGMKKAAGRESHAAWAVRDGLDRAILRNARSPLVRTMGL